MKKMVLVGVGFAAALSLLWAGLASAANVRGGDSPRVTADEVVDGTLYVGGKSISIEGQVKGDVFCAGQTLDITGTVEGDVLCAAQTVTIGGHVTGDVRVAGQLVAVKGKVDGSVSAAGQNVSIMGAAMVGRDLTVVAQQAVVDATIGRDAQAIAETVTSDAIISRNFNANATTITLHEKTKVGGDFMYTSQDEAAIASGAQVAGKTDHQLPPPRERMPAVDMTHASLFGFSTMLLVGIGLLVAVPRLMAATATAMHQSPMGTLVAGCVGLFLPPIVALMLCVTVVGVGLGLLLFFGWIVSVIISVALSAHVVGQAILAKTGWNDTWQHLASVVLGLLVLFVLSLIPLFGMLVIFAATVWGVGSQWYLIIKRRGHSLGAEVKKA